MVITSPDFATEDYYYCMENLEKKVLTSDFQHLNLPHTTRHPPPPNSELLMDNFELIA